MYVGQSNRHHHVMHPLQRKTLHCSMATQWNLLHEFDHVAAQIDTQQRHITAHKAAAQSLPADA